MKLLKSLLLVIGLWATSVWPQSVWLPHPNPTNGRFTQGVYYRIFVNNMGQQFIQLRSTLGHYVQCSITSNYGVFYTVTLVPSNRTYENTQVSKWYPVGHASNIAWDYVCN